MRMSPLRAAFAAHTSFSDIASLYDGFILDQFGVLHNGKQGLPGAVDCVKRLHSSGKKLIILSNTSSPSETAVSKLPKLGFDSQLFEGAVTSGEEASRYIAKTYGKDPDAKKCLWLTWSVGENGPNTLDFLARCGKVEPVDTIDEAEFVIAHGSEIIRGPGSDGEAHTTSLGSFMADGDFSVIDPILTKCQERNLPMVCANPDFVVITGDDSIRHMPGKIAQRYEAMGGWCMSFGKPHVAHFEACLRELGLEKHQVAHVGDSIHHDIAGANAAGIDSVFVTGGIHCDELGSPLGELPDVGVLDKKFEVEGQKPTHVIPMFRF